MSDRLDELKRQRALVAAHLAWLDREIAAGETASHVPVRTPGDQAASQFLATTTARTKPLLPAVDRPPVDSTTALDPEEIIARFGDEKNSGPQLSKRGCWTIFYGVLLLGVVAISLLIYLRYY